MPTAFLHPYARPAADDFVMVSRGRGAAVFDADGNRYVDALASLWYCNAGHGRHEIIGAITGQLHELDAFHTFERFTNEPAEALCARLADLAPMPGARVFLTDSGSESVDTALKLARLNSTLRGEPDRQLIISREHAYHGVTYGGLSVQGLPANQYGFGPLLSGIRTVGHHDIDGLASVFADHPHHVAGVILEPVQGAGGVHPPVPGYLEAARDLCDEHGALLIVDEVVSGFGRTGAWWACERYGITPDLVAFAKGVTSGYLPLGGVLVGSRVREALEADPTFVLRHGHTYSGHPTTCAAALANIEVIAADGLATRASAIGERLGVALDALVEAGTISEARGVAGIWACDLDDGVDATAVRDVMLGLGVIARPIGSATIALCPPLIIGDDDLDLCVHALGEAVGVIAARRR